MTDAEIKKPSLNINGAEIKRLAEDALMCLEPFEVRDVVAKMQETINRQQEDNERLKKLLEEADVNYNKCAKRFYKEGVKEFAERLKEELFLYCETVVEGNDMEGITDVGYRQEDTIETIDNLVKEMVGE